jgi:hypothetical protein
MKFFLDQVLIEDQDEYQQDSFYDLQSENNETILEEGILDRVKINFLLGTTTLIFEMDEINILELDEAKKNLEGFSKLLGIKLT